MSLVKTPADDSKTAAAEDHEVAAATKSGRPTTKDAALLAFVSSIGPFAANAYVPAFDEIGQHYGVGLVTVQQTLSIYLAAFACTSLLIGAASDAFGRKAVLALSMTVFAVSSLGLLFADSMEAFFIWRFVMGMAAAAGPVVTQAIVRDRWSGGDAAKIIALIAVIFGLAPALAPVVGGELTVHLGWRSIFIFLAVLSAAMAFCSACVLKESLPSERRVSFRPWATLLRYGEVLKVPAFTSGVVAHGFIFLGLIVYSAGAADFVLNVMGLGVDEFGWLMIPMVVAGMTGSWACAHLLAMFGQNRLLFGGVGILAAAAVRPALNVMNLDYFPKSRGLAASVQQFFQTGAFAVSSALLIPIVLGEAWKYAAVMLGSGLIALVLLLVVRRTRPAALAAAEAEEQAEVELRVKPTKLS
ncbi:multidrug effflux MFS transporter [Sutterella wadsworthensis]|uniref:multidrug effflux MFS transporter n=1 Tax=Sutterella wadsworthensis TaxID=40545 RepID=UPI00242A9705|nr:multidrug effflux MFS transporter [Sutterella wadsworthensis]